MARRARLTTGQEVTVDDAGAEALSRAPQFLTWVDDLVDVPKADGTTIKAHRGTVPEVMKMPGMAPVVDAPTPPDTRGRTPIKQTDGSTMWVPPEFVDVALRQPSSAGGEAMRKLVDEPRRRAALPTGDVGAWSPPADWAKGGAKLRAIEASPREAALERLGSGEGLVFSNPDTGEFSVNVPRNNYVNAPGDMGASPKVKPQIGITPDEYRAMAATQEGLAADEDEADRRRQAMLDLVNRTKVPPKPSASHPTVSVQQVGNGGSVRAPVDLAALAPAGSMERGLSAAGFPSPSPVATGGAPTSKTPIADELGRLQQQAALSLLGTGISRAGARINEALTGAKPTPGFYEGLDEEAGNQIRDYVQRQGLAQQESDRARKLGEEAALKDPFSAESKRFQAALAKTLPGVYTPEELSQLTAADAPMVTDFAKMKSALDARKAEALAEKERADAARTAASTEAEKQRTFQAEQNRLNRAVDYARIGAAKEKAGAKAAGGGAGTHVPAGEAADLGEANSAIEAADKVFAQYKDKSGDWYSGLSALVPGTKATQYEDDDRRAASQVIGRFLEGGKLAQGDEVKYMNLMPRAGDSEERAQNKIDNLKRLINERQQQRIAGLKAAGYKMGDLGAQPTVTAQADTAAVAWAKANPDDPRAARILKANGVTQ